MKEHFRAALSLKSVRGPRKPDAVVRALCALNKAIPLNLTHTYTHRTMPVEGKKSKELFSEERIESNALDSRVYKIYADGDGDFSAETSVYLRPLEPDYHEAKGCEITVLFERDVTPDMRSVEVFVKTMANEYSLTQGFLASYAFRDHAMSDLNVPLVQSRIEASLKERQAADYDAMSEFSSKLRRLYPVTFIGTTMWNKLPALPDVRPAPIVKDLGDCKMLIAWPELCSPYAPEFLAGTRELRTWLWPYTIQNPYDKRDLDV